MHFIIILLNFISLATTGIPSTADMPLDQLIQALSTQQPGACKLPCIEVAV